MMVNSFSYQGETIEYQLIKSKRKTISIRVTDQEVSVRAPKNMSNAKIHELVLTRAAWIGQKRLELMRQSQERPHHTYETGDEFLYQGDKITLMVNFGEFYQVKLELQERKLIVTLPHENPEEVQILLEQWYRQQAKRQITLRVQEYQRQYQYFEAAKRITIKDQKSRWGSCSTKGNLNFNYRLIMAPPQVLDYVVVHELCHLCHMNHSQEFWSLVGQIMPEYGQMRQWLKLHGKMLH